MKFRSVSKNIWDVVVIGGGPSGMMAAGTAAALGGRVILVEKNPNLGKKLLITGGGRCNVTNAETDNKKLLAKFGKSGKFLFSAFSQWDVKNTLKFFHDHGMETKIENELRVFPVSNKAQSVWNVLNGYLKDGKVSILTGSPVASFITSGKKTISGVKLTNGDIVQGKKFILATGGKSHPETGSTGDGFEWLRLLGHKVTDTAPSLVPIKLSDPWIKRLQGVSIPKVHFDVLQNDKRQAVHKGKILFTHFGVSGPTILNMSNQVRELLEYGTVTITTDFVPNLDHKRTDTAIQNIFKLNRNKIFKNIVTHFLPASIILVLGGLAGIDEKTPCHSISRESRLRLVQFLKALPLHVSGVLGVEKAIVTSGGIALEEVDFKTMRSRKISNLYLTGDILNIVRPSGGYSLQLCWTTGTIAGKHAV